jgi:RimJ/RimL family protein N-acetyltransferase
MHVAAAGDPLVNVVIARTAISNIASQRVLRRNGFAPVNAGHDPSEGEMILWRLAITA